MPVPTSAVKVNPVTGALIDPPVATFAAANGLLTGGSSDAKDSVRAATTTNGTLATAYENGDTIDGIVLATGDRILIKDQSAPAENGIYVVAASGAPTRATDFDAWTEIVGAFVSVEAGTVNAGTQWLCNVAAGGTLGTTAITFVVPKNYVDLTTTQTVTGAKTFSNITGSVIESTTIGVTTPAAGWFTLVNGLYISVGSGASLGISGDLGVSFDAPATESIIIRSAASSDVTLPTSGTLLSTADLGTNVGTFLATPSGANLASALTSALPLTKGGTGGTTAYTAIVGIGLINPIGRVVIWDDFYSGSGTSGGIGQLGWTFLNQVGTGSGTGSVTVSSSHAGAYKVTSGATSGNASSIYIANSSVALTNSFDTRVWEMWARVKIDQVTTVGAYIGLHWATNVATILDPAGSGSNNKGYFICFDTGITTPDTQWSLKVCSDATGTLGKVSTSAFTGTIAADTWYVFRMRGDGTGTIYATMYDSTGAIVGSEISVPSTNAIANACTPMPQIVTRTASARAVTIDFIGFACQMTR